MGRILNILAFVACLFGVAVGQSEAACPTITVIGPAGIVQPGEWFTFIGTLDGKTPENVEFEWTVTNGKIVKGQGTPKVSVDVEWNAGGTTITATLNVRGLPDGCPKSASGTAGVIIDPVPLLIDEFGRLPNDVVRKRLDKLFAELAKNPTSQGYIILYGTNREMTARERLITSNIRFRRFDQARITMVRAGTHPSGMVFTRLYRVPPGAENPAP